MKKNNASILLKGILKENPDIIHCYTSAQGDAGARQRFADSLNRRFGGNYTADQFYITVGAAASSFGRGNDNDHLARR